MTDDTAFHVRRAQWPADELAIRHVRTIVFVKEQAVPVDLEWDGKDARCIHALAEGPGGEAVATGRLAPDGKIGRMAVLKSLRGLGIGERILAHLLEAAHETGIPRCYLHSQVHALPFYAKQGFVAHGPEFMEADIPHREMELEMTHD